jgi:hypothetical protein
MAYLAAYHSLGVTTGLAEPRSAKHVPVSTIPIHMAIPQDDQQVYPSTDCPFYMRQLQPLSISQNSIFEVNVPLVSSEPRCFSSGLPVVIDLLPTRLTQNEDQNRTASSGTAFWRPSIIVPKARTTPPVPTRSGQLRISEELHPILRRTDVHASTHGIAMHR